MPRRADREGSIRRRGDTWQGRITLAGKGYSASAGTRKEVVLKIQDLVRQHEEGRLGAPLLTTGEWLIEWMARGRASWKPTTAARYAEVVKLHIHPALGAVPLCELTGKHISACVSAPKGGATRQKAYRILHRAMVVAMLDGLIQANPCDQVESPRAPAKRPELWSQAELAKFLSKCYEGQSGLLWAVLLGTGCRLGEGLGLNWGDFNEGDGTIRIRRTLSEVAGGKVLTLPKTEAAVRVVRLPEPTLAVLRQWVGTEGVMLPGISRKLAQRWMVRDCEAAGVPLLRVHDLRHMHASILLDAGVPIPEVAARLGHATPAVTMSVYAHVLKGREQASLQALGTALRPAQQTQGQPGAGSTDWRPSRR